MIFLLSTILGFIILPFRIGTYTFINLRTAAIIYFLIALLVAQMRFRGWWRYSLVGFASLCMIHSVVKQARISAEINEIVPIVSAIPSNARILPLVFDPAPRNWTDTGSTFISTNIVTITSLSAVDTTHICSRRRLILCITEAGGSDLPPANTTPTGSPGKNTLQIISIS